jgi:hypothetical protein
VCERRHCVAPDTHASNKNGFQAAIPETLRSAARSRIIGGTRIAKVRAGYSNLAAKGLDTIGDPAEQKMFCCRKSEKPTVAEINDERNRGRKS